MLKKKQISKMKLSSVTPADLRAGMVVLYRVRKSGKIKPHDLRYRVLGAWHYTSSGDEGTYQRSTEYQKFPRKIEVAVSYSDGSQEVRIWENAWWKGWHDGQKISNVNLPVLIPADESFGD